MPGVDMLDITYVSISRFESVERQLTLFVTGSREHEPAVIPPGPQLHVVNLSDDILRNDDNYDHLTRRARGYVLKSLVDTLRLT